MGGALTNGQLSLNNLDLDTMGGNCSLSLTLSDTDNPNPFGVPSPTLSTNFSIGSQPSYNFASTVDATCQKFCNRALADITYDGPGQPPAGANWTITTNGCPNVSPVSSAGPAFPYQIQLTCGNPGHATFTVSWEYLGVTNNSQIGGLQGSFGTTTTSSTTVATTTTSSTSVPASTTTTAPKATTTAATTTTTAPKATSTAASTTTTTAPKATTTAAKTAAAAASFTQGASAPSALAAASGEASAAATDRAGTWVIEGAVGLVALSFGSGLLRRRRRPTASQRENLNDNQKKR
jgi:hypothetical protein